MGLPTHAAWWRGSPEPCAVRRGLNLLACFTFMSDQPESNPAPTPSIPPNPGETIPLEPVASAPVPNPTPRPSVLKSAADVCPNCGAKLDPDAIVCMSCGFDMKSNQVLRPEMGVDLIEPPAIKPPFVKPGIKPAMLVIGGTIALAAAMIAAGVNGTPRASMGSSAVFALLVLYKAILHTGTGLAGLWAAAKFVDHRLNHVDLAAARMFAAVAAFMLVWSLRIPIEMTFLEHTLRFIAAVACYWMVLFALFRRSRQETTMIVLFHFGAVMFVELGFQIAVWLETSVSAKPG